MSMKRKRDLRGGERKDVDKEVGLRQGLMGLTTTRHTDTRKRGFTTWIIHMFDQVGRRSYDSFGRVMDASIPFFSSIKRNSMGAFDVAVIWSYRVLGIADADVMDHPFHNAEYWDGQH